jgi:hypothetical protein
MSRHWDDRETIERRIYRALVVDRFGEVSWREYIQQRKQRQQ